MIRIIFTSDFRGKPTGEIFYTAGSEVNLPAPAAAQIVALGRAVYAEAPEVAATPKPEPEPEQPEPKARKARKQ